MSETDLQVASTDLRADCWLYLGRHEKKGYGVIDIGDKSYLAHRVSYETHIGPIPNGLCVCHSCDNPTCINPEHLWLGTSYQNIQDAKQKGHFKNIHDGELNGRAKLTSSDVMTIRDLRSKGMKLSSLAEKFNVAASTIGYVIYGGTWKCLEAKNVN